MQCKKEVEDNFEICWNCCHDKTDSRSTFQNIIGDQEQISVENQRLKENASNSLNRSLEKTSINSAGTSLKKVVFTAVLSILLTILGISISFNLKDPETIKNAYSFIGIVNLICYIFILTNLYNAGDHLENS